MGGQLESLRMGRPERPLDPEAALESFALALCRATHAPVALVPAVNNAQVTGPHPVQSSPPRSLFLQS